MHKLFLIIFLFSCSVSYSQRINKKNIASVYCYVDSSSKQINISYLAFLKNDSVMLLTVCEKGNCASWLDQSRSTKDIFRQFLNEYTKDVMSYKGVMDFGKRNADLTITCRYAKYRFEFNDDKLELTLIDEVFSTKNLYKKITL